MAAAIAHHHHHHHFFHNTTSFQTTSCYELEASNPNRIWKSNAIIEYEGQLLCSQIAYAIFTSNLFYVILKPFHQPRIVAEILAGFTLSPLCLGRTIIGKVLLAPSGILNIETYANIGLMCYVLLSGLEMNLDTVLHIRRKGMSIAVAGIIVPVAIGAALFAMLRQFYERSALETHLREDDKLIVKAYLFWGLALSITGFPILARILTDLKLLNTRLGRITLTSAMISDTYGWFLFVVLIPFANNDGTPAVFSALSTLLFVLICFFLVRPIITRYINHKTDTDTWENSQLAILLFLGAIVCSYITDLLGSHSIVGAFVYGLILPNGRFADLVMGKVDDFASGIISSIFFFRCGLTFNLVTVAQQKYWPLMALVILLLFIPKIISTMIAAFFFNIPARDGLGIGLLLNTKGVLALVILNIAVDKKILSVVHFTIMVSAVFLMTIMAPVFVSAMYQPRKRFEMYKLRTVQKLRPETELRILACVHNVRQAASMVSVLKYCNATRISPMQVFGVRLVEFRGRAAASTLFATDIEQPSLSGSPSITMSSQSESESINNTFTYLSELNHAVRVETTDAMSVYETIHDDIYSLAQQKLTSLVLLPYHKQVDVEGGLETTNDIYKDINLNVQQNPPCSVGIFIDRGLGTTSSSKINMSILMLFIGGPDDREALAVTWRMAGQPGTELSVVRIVLYGEATEVSLNDESQWLSSSVMDDVRQKSLDDEYLDSFRLEVVHNNDFVTYSEEEVGSGEELTSLMEEFAKDDHDLVIVGKGNNRNLAVFSNFLEWCDNPELGVLGDMVASNNFGSQSSLIVVQQYESTTMENRGAQTRQPIVV